MTNALYAYIESQFNGYNPHVQLTQPQKDQAKEIAIEIEREFHIKNSPYSSAAAEEATFEDWWKNDRSAIWLRAEMGEPGTRNTNFDEFISSMKKDIQELKVLNSNQRI